MSSNVIHQPKYLIEFTQHVYVTATAVPLLMIVQKSQIH